MKKIILTLTAFATLFANAQLQNNGFENWITITKTKEVKQWKTSNDPNSTYKTVTKSDDAYNKKASIKLETKTNGTDIFFGFTIFGDLGDNGAEGGFPYSSIPDSLIFWTKYNVVSGDSATAFIATRNNGTNLSIDIIKWVGTQNIWERKAIAVSSTTTVDSLVVAFIAGNALVGKAKAGTWILIDNVLIKDKNGILTEAPNHSFENWDETSYTNPKNWFSINQYIIGNEIVSKSTQKYEGNFAAKIAAISIENEPYQGLMSNAPYNTNTEWFETMPYTGKPTELELYYKYEGNNGDGAGFTIELYNRGNLVGKGLKYSSDSVHTYQLVNIPIIYTREEAPDAIRIVFSAGGKPGSSLWVDNIKLIDNTIGISKVNEISTVLLYPNPTFENVNITFKSAFKTNGKISIYTLNGEEIWSENILIVNGGNIQKIDMSKYSAGVYLLSINMGDRILTKKLIKN